VIISEVESTDVSHSCLDEVFNEVRNGLLEEFRIAAGEVIFVQHRTLPRAPSGKISRFQAKLHHHNAQLQILERFKWGGDGDGGIYSISSSPSFYCPAKPLPPPSTHNYPDRKTCISPTIHPPLPTGMILQLPLNPLDTLSDLESSSCRSPNTPTPPNPIRRKTAGSHDNALREADESSSGVYISIAIIGATLGGIVSALELARLGYRVTVFEKYALGDNTPHSLDVHGTCHCIRPLRLYATDTSTVPDAEKVFRDLNINIEKSIDIHNTIYYDESGRIELNLPKEFKRGFASIQALARAILEDFGESTPSYEKMLSTAEGRRPIQEWLDGHSNCQIAADLLTIAITAEGLGYLGSPNLNAATWLSVALDHYPLLGSPKAFHCLYGEIEGGLQSVWRAASAYLGTGVIRFGCHVDRVIREEFMTSQGDVSIRINGCPDLLSFDKVLFATSAATSLSLLANPQQSELRLLECPLGSSNGDDFLTIVASVRPAEKKSSLLPSTITKAVYLVNNSQSISQKGCLTTIRPLSAENYLWAFSLYPSSCKSVDEICGDLRVELAQHEVVIEEVHGVVKSSGVTLSAYGNGSLEVDLVSLLSEIQGIFGC
jgi:glycine/D-amino acid oxidase-like deaminating enzyme